MNPYTVHIYCMLRNGCFHVVVPSCPFLHSLADCSTSWWMLCMNDKTMKAAVLWREYAWATKGINASLPYEEPVSCSRGSQGLRLAKVIGFCTGEAGCRRNFEDTPPKA